MAILKKDILQGKELIETVPIESLNQDVDLRPLTDGEYHEVEAIRKDLGKIKIKLKNVDKSLDPESQVEAQRKALEGQNLDMDIKKLSMNNYNANAKAAAFGLSHSGQKWTDTEVKKLPSGAASEIAKAVYEISHLDIPESLQKDVESFRK